MYTAIELSKYIVSKCIDDDHPIGNLQLQKILYYIQKDFLSRGEAAFSDEIEAWQFGPVVPNVYYRYCGYGAMPISISPGHKSINESDATFVDRIVDSKRILNPWDLVKETHKPNGAWEKAYKNGKNGLSNIITLDMIQAEG